MSFINTFWTEKYRPTSLNNFIFHSEAQKKQLANIVKNQDIGHLLFSGVQGTGKTTLSKILINELDIDEADVLVINSSDENSVDTIRDKVTTFAQSFPMGKFLIIRLEEMDYLSLSAQAVLRNVMEEYSSTCKFICTCNYENKIMPALKSRMQHFHFSTPIQEDVSVRVAEILISENIHFEIDILEKYVSSYYPDIRKIINSLQQNVVNSELLPPNEEADGDYKFKILELLELDDFKELRKLVCSSINKDDYEDMYRFLYRNLHKSQKFSNEDNYEAGIVLIANYLYKHSICADPEINLAALFIELKMI